MENIFLARLFFHLGLSNLSTFSLEAFPAMDPIQPNRSGALPERLCQIITPIGMLGYGFNVAGGYSGC